MKRRDLIRHLEEHGARLLREGGRHTIYVNPRARRSTTVPRHNKINDHLARKIRRVGRAPIPAPVRLPRR